MLNKVLYQILTLLFTIQNLQLPAILMNAVFLSFSHNFFLDIPIHSYIKKSDV